MSTGRIKTGGGTFDPQGERIYFIASGVGRLKLGAEAHDHLLIAVNELQTPKELDHVQQWIDEGKKVFLDSGVYNLATTYAQTHGLSMDVALSTPPEEVDGFEALFEKYVTLVQRFQDGLWGYIEVDQGGKDNKIRTRTRLELLGLRPIPVYHPLNDGWDYFDMLAQQYDRLCFGNVVQADRRTRVRLLATMWQRHRRYPDLWIHLLGLTPNAWMNSYPSNSADSSTWLSGIRWGAAMKERAMGSAVGRFPLNFRYQYKSDPRSEVGSHKAVYLAAYWSAMMERNWRAHMAALDELGIEVYPDE